ncbi:hypothetical protein FISHEDRAFT_58626 [Fistulina hepatica ATCC 64428]|uniref:Uncharacterized protein n=1 Tax=Fistulina hepatica ATCC 64428 TaxID=1128425 RepID=A0A0D7AG59_9AGAR|nr:hypothetical protein FISHEDRAFT_58626 [Fistulina hepatica ATCC 64428]
MLTHWPPRKTGAVMLPNVKELVHVSKSDAAMGDVLSSLRERSVRRKKSCMLEPGTTAEVLSSGVEMTSVVKQRAFRTFYKSPLESKNELTAVGRTGAIRGTAKGQPQRGDTEMAKARGWRHAHSIHWEYACMGLYTTARSPILKGTHRSAQKLEVLIAMSRHGEGWQASEWVAKLAYGLSYKQGMPTVVTKYPGERCQIGKEKNPTLARDMLQSLLQTAKVHEV